MDFDVVDEKSVEYQSVEDWFDVKVELNENNLEFIKPETHWVIQGALAIKDYPEAR
jgi:hypothetical protein